MRWQIQENVLHSHSFHSQLTFSPLRMPPRRRIRSKGNGAGRVHCVHLRKQVCSKESLAQSGAVGFVSQTVILQAFCCLESAKRLQLSPGRWFSTFYTMGQVGLKFHSCVTRLLLLSQKDTWMPCVHIMMGLSCSLPGCLFFHMCTIFLLSHLSGMTVFLKDIGSLFLTLVTFIPITHP